MTSVIGLEMPRSMPRTRPQPQRQRRFRRNFIREWRKHRGLTLEELEERSGVSTSTISNIERGIHGYTSDSLERLAGALDAEPGDLLSRPPMQDAINDLWTALDLCDQGSAAP